MEKSQINTQAEVMFLNIHKAIGQLEAMLEMGCALAALLTEKSINLR